MATEKKEEAKKTVKIRIPRIKNDDSDVFVSVNEKTYLIKRGEEVEVPESVAEVIRNAEAMEEEAYAFDEATKK